MNEQALPTAPGVTLFLDETGSFPVLIVTAPKAALTKPVVAVCHSAAGNAGAAIRFDPT